MAESPIARENARRYLWQSGKPYRQEPAVPYSRRFFEFWIGLFLISALIVEIILLF